MTDKTETKKSDKKKGIEGKKVNNEIDFNPNVYESMSLDEAVLSLVQRKKKARNAKRYKVKMARGRKLALKKTAGKSSLSNRAMIKARSTMKNKLSGGRDYKSLSAGQKAMVDKRLEAKKKILGRLKTRLVRKARKVDINRRAGKAARYESLDMLFSSEILNENYDTYENYTIQEAIDETILNQVLEYVELGYTDNEKSALLGLQKISMKTKVPYVNLVNVYESVENDPVLGYTAVVEYFHGMNDIEEDVIMEAVEKARLNRILQDRHVKNAFMVLDKMAKNPENKTSIENLAFQVLKSYDLDMTPREMAAAYRQKEGL